MLATDYRDHVGRTGDPTPGPRYRGRRKLLAGRRAFLRTARQRRGRRESTRERRPGTRRAARATYRGIWDDGPVGLISISHGIRELVMFRMDNYSSNFRKGPASRRVGIRRLRAESATHRALVPPRPGSEVLALMVRPPAASFQQSHIEQLRGPANSPGLPGGRGLMLLCPRAVMSDWPRDRRFSPLAETPCVSVSGVLRRHARRSFCSQ